jgi:hypothetical protein
VTTVSVMCLIESWQEQESAIIGCLRNVGLNGVDPPNRELLLVTFPLIQVSSIPLLHLMSSFRRSIH